MRVRFWGVRGSLPVPGAKTERYGGNTSCVEVKSAAGTRIIIDILNNESRINPARVLIDHAEEHTIGLIKSGGFWFGLTLYPDSKGSPARAVDAIETFGAGQICINSSADWSVSDPSATLKTVNEMRRRGHADELIRKVFFENPAGFLGQSPKFSVA